MGLNHTSIYNVFFMCLCNLNARFTLIFVKIILIPHLLIFYRIKRKIKQSDGRNQVTRKLLICNSLLTAAIRFTTAKECFATTKLKSRIQHPWVCCNEGICSPRRSSFPLRRKGFVATNMKPWVHRSKDTLRHSEAILNRSKGNIDQKVTRGFAMTKKPLLQRRTTGWSSKL